MKPKRLAVVGMLLAAAFAMAAAESATALAETVKARRTANVYVSRGERSKVVTTVRSGKRLEVLGRKGRWLKVRVNGKTGWIVRSNIEQSAKARDSRDRKTRRRAFVTGRSRKRDLRRKSAPKDRYGLDATNTEAGVDSDDFVIVDDGSTDPIKRKKRRKEKPRKNEDVEDEDLEDDIEDSDLELDDLEDDEELGDDLEDDEEDVRPEYVFARVDVDLRAGKAKDAEEVSLAKPGDRLAVVERDGDWIKVTTSEGDTGWVPSEKVRGQSKYQFLVRGSLGLGSYSQSFTSDSTMLFGNYDIGARAAVIGATGEMLYDYSADYMLGAELDLSYSYSTPGIRVEENDNAADTGFSVLDAILVAKGGKKLHAGTKTVAYLRLGYRYQSFQIKNVDDFTNNLATLPSENLKSPVLGVELAVPQLTDKISARVIIDTMLVGASRSQTAGLEDGQTSRAKALLGGAVVTYDYKPNLTLLAGYNYHWAKTEWAGAASSMRKHDATEAERADSTHVVSFGVAKGF